MSNGLVMLSNHLILCNRLTLWQSIFPSIRVFSNELAICIRWPKYWSFLPICHMPILQMGSPDSSVGKESACNAGDLGSIPGSGRTAREGIGYPLQYGIPEIVYSLIYCWMFCSFPNVCYYELNYNKHSCTNFSLWM